MRDSFIALIGGFILDLVFGDPGWLYHPVCFIGNMISFLEKRIRKIFPAGKKGELAGGILEVFLVCICSYGLPFILIQVLQGYVPEAGFLLKLFWCYQLFAAKSLKTESMKVYECLKNGTIEEARYAVSMIVGRDTQSLSETGVIKATIETIAESTSDGVIAPGFYMMIGGVPLMFLYKAINTMDSMLGYKNEKYLYFGRCAAKLDDFANYVPARISGIMMTAASFVTGLNGKNAWKIFLRDRRNHASPNSAHTESAMAGALNVQLAGDAWYFGTLYKKPFIGDKNRSVETEDIVRANKLMYATSILCMILFSVFGYFIA